MSAAGSARIEVAKTLKLYVNGAFPRSESGRTIPVKDARKRIVAQASHASRKDLRDAVEAANAAQPKWAAATAYNRGQVVYRLAEMLEARRAEFVSLIVSIEGRSKADATREIDRAIDRCVCYAGWTDKIASILGGKQPVAGPYFVFSMPEAMGTVAVVVPDGAQLLAIVSLVLPVIAAGNSAIVIAPIGANAPLAIAFAEAVATSDVPAGIVNVLTGMRSELAPWIASHRDIAGVAGAQLPAAEAAALEAGAAENLKRVALFRDAPKFDDDAFWHSPWAIQPFVEIKTVWHPSAL
ncbi:MAG: aldehyde dehydrogenase family protein [Planctomycetaceae bacterium]|nr:aldehyde dehydrogenase family protein [Planctomycetaceae bacterium]